MSNCWRGNFLRSSCNLSINEAVAPVSSMVVMS